MDKDIIVKQVVDKFNERSRRGIEKYGTSLQDAELSMIEWLTHLQEELMDATLYIQKLKNELQDIESWDNADKITHNGFIYVKYSDVIKYKK